MLSRKRRLTPINRVQFFTRLRGTLTPTGRRSLRTNLPPLLISSPATNATSANFADSPTAIATIVTIVAATAITSAFEAAIAPTTLTNIMTTEIAKSYSNLARRHRDRDRDHYRKRDHKYHCDDKYRSDDRDRNRDRDGDLDRTSKFAVVRRFSLQQDLRYLQPALPALLREDGLGLFRDN